MNASDITKEASLEQLIIAELGEAPSKEGAQRTRDNMEAMAKEKQKQKELEEQKEKDKDKNKDDDDNLHRQ